MRPIFRTKLYKAFFTTKRDGNVDVRFSSDAFTNRQRILDELGIHNTAWMKAHGKLEFADITDAKNMPAWSEYNVDALITRPSSGIALALFPADCIPLVIGATKQDILLFIHVGRRNAEAGIVEKLYEYIRQTYGIKPQDTEVFVGPSIRQDSYYFKVIDDAQKKNTRWQHRLKHNSGKYHVDLLGFTIDRLLELGIKQSKILVSETDTGSNKAYFSHARSVRTGEPEGRNMFIIKPLEQ